METQSEAIRDFYSLEGEVCAPQLARMLQAVLQSSHVRFKGEKGAEVYKIGLEILTTYYGQEKEAKANPAPQETL